MKDMHLLRMELFHEDAGKLAGQLSITKENATLIIAYRKSDNWNAETEIEIIKRAKDGLPLDKPLEY